MSSASEVTRQALLLPEEARATLAEVLLDSLDLGQSQQDSEMAAVLEAGSQAIREGRATFRAPDEIFEEYERMKSKRRTAQAG